MIENIHGYFQSEIGAVKNNFYNVLSDIGPVNPSYPVPILFRFALYTGHGTIRAFLSLGAVFLTLWVWCSPVCAAEPFSGLPQGEGWVVMPAGARRSYMGIHGGTMPVSLLVAADGQSLLTFVGRTGNDFLQMLRETDVPLPTLLNSTITAEAMTKGQALLPATAGHLPIMAAKTHPPAGVSSGPLAHFGLSAMPLAGEGTISRPHPPTPERKFRISFSADFLQPRR